MTWFVLSAREMIKIDSIKANLATKSLGHTNSPVVLLKCLE